jgi:hypothetical protein
MPQGDNLTHDHQMAAGRMRWSKPSSRTPEARAAHLRAVAAGFLRRADELDPRGADTFAANDRRAEE